jgi:predicted nucleotide-binding protein
MKNTISKAFEFGKLTYIYYLTVTRGLVIPERMKSEFFGLCSVFKISLPVDVDVSFSVDIAHRIEVSFDEEAATAYRLGFLLSASKVPMEDEVISQEIDRAWVLLGLPDLLKKRFYESSDANMGSDVILEVGEKLAAHPRIRSNRVFITHGHNEAVRESVARFVEGLSLKPIILQEQPNRGMTIIEKFSEYADVVFAIVLLTSDDIGGTIGTSLESLSPRAHQNVIFELGYFLGKLGRGHVCALLESGVEIPSNYNAVVYLPLDSAGAWRTALAKELKSAGLDVELNKLV